MCQFGLSNRQKGEARRHRGTGTTASGLFGAPVPLCRRAPASPDQPNPEATTTNEGMSGEAAEAVVLDSDRALAEQVLAGDELAFRQLYRRHSPRLFLFILRLMNGQEAEAEDVVQETWLKATERLTTFRWEASFGSWLTAIGLNVAREQLRRRGRRREDVVEGFDAPAPEIPARFELMDLERAIRDLPDGYRTVLVLHDVEGYRHEEIAGQLGISVGTSKSQLFHARRRVRTALSEARKDPSV